MSWAPSAFPCVCHAAGRRCCFPVARAEPKNPSGRTFSSSCPGSGEADYYASALALRLAPERVAVTAVAAAPAAAGHEGLDPAAPVAGLVGSIYSFGGAGGPAAPAPSLCHLPWVAPAQTAGASILFFCVCFL